MADTNSQAEANPPSSTPSSTPTSIKRRASKSRLIDKEKKQRGTESPVPAAINVVEQPANPAEHSDDEGSVDHVLPASSSPQNEAEASSLPSSQPPLNPSPFEPAPSSDAAPSLSPASSTSPASPGKPPLLKRHSKKTQLKPLAKKPALAEPGAAGGSLNPLPLVAAEAPAVTTDEIANKTGLVLMNETEKDKERRKSTFTKDRGRWGQARAMVNLRKVDILDVAVTSISLSWDPLPTKPFRCCGYIICMQEVGRTGFLPVVEDTLAPITNYVAIDLQPDTAYRFMIVALAQSPVDSKYKGARLAIPMSSIKSVIVRTHAQNYEFAWFFESAKMATRTWRCYTGAVHMSHEPNEYKTVISKFVEVEHSKERCYSGIHSLKMTFPGVEHGDFTDGGTATDCELQEDRLFILRVRVYHEWQQQSYFRDTKKILRIDEDEGVALTFEKKMKRFYNNIDPDIVALYEAEKAEHFGTTDDDGGEIVDMFITPPTNPEEPVVMTTTRKYLTQPPKSFARLGVWDKLKTRVWSKKETADEVPLNEWHTLECSIIGTSSGRGKIFLYVPEGYQGSVYVDDMEIIWGGPTPTEQRITKAIAACEQTHTDHTSNMRVNLLDARDLQAVDWGGSSDPYATVFLCSGEAGRMTETEVLKSPVVFADLFPVWNCDPILFDKPPPPPIINAIDQEEAKKDRHGDGFKEASSFAVAHEKRRFKELRKEGKSVMEANKIAVKERNELMTEYKSAAGNAEAKADAKDPAQFNLKILINDKDLVGDDDFMGEVIVTKRQLFLSAQRCCKYYFNVTGVIGEGRQKKPATGMVSVIVRTHEYHNENSKFGRVCKLLMDGTPKERDDSIHYCMQVFNMDLPLFDELDQIVEVMKEPVVEELVCHISDPRRCEAACFALMGMLGDRNDPRNKKTWGYQYRRCIQERICRCGGADACAEGILSWDTGSAKLTRKACCLELLVRLSEDNKHLLTKLIKMNQRILIASVAALAFIEDVGEEDEEPAARINTACRALMKNIMYEDKMDEEVVHALWRVRRFIPLEDGLWKSPALAALGSNMSDMPDDDELKELVDVRNMKKAGAWKKALTEATFWLGMAVRASAPVVPLIMIVKGIQHYSDYCARNLAGFLIGDGFLLLFTVFVIYLFEVSVRIMNMVKSPFFFSPFVVALGIGHWVLWTFGFKWYKESLPKMDYTWTFTSWDERHAEYDVVWGAPTAAPTGAPLYDNYGCQNEMMDTFMTMQIVTGLIGLVWIGGLWKALTYTPKIKTAEEAEEVAKSGGLAAMKERMKKEHGPGRGATMALLGIEPGEEDKAPAQVLQKILEDAADGEEGEAADVEEEVVEVAKEDAKEEVQEDVKKEQVREEVKEEAEVADEENQLGGVQDSEANVDAVIEEKDAVDELLEEEEDAERVGGEGKNNEDVVVEKEVKEVEVEVEEKTRVGEDEEVTANEVAKDVDDIV
jgi:hypothetical protein